MQNLKRYLFVSFLIIFSGWLCSQELEPRAYSVVPKDINLALLAYSYSTGAVVTDASSPVKDFHVIAHTGTTGYYRTFGLFGKLARVGVMVPFVYMHGDVVYKGNDTSGSRTGLADTRIRFGVNIFGSPALSPKDFQKFKEQSVLGASIVVSLPTGQYDKSKIINLGAHRWGFKPEIGFSYGYNRFYFEVYTGMWFFTANKEYIQTNVLKQDPVYSLQVHVLYVFRRMWAGLDGTYYGGGQTQVNDVYQSDLMSNTRLGGALGFSLAANHSLKIQGHTGAITRSGQSYTIFSVAYQYIWF